MTDSNPTPPRSRPRLVPRDGALPARIRAIGRPKPRSRDVYMRLVSASWKRLIAFIALLYFSINIFFGGIYYFLSDQIENVRPGSFADAFFFSVQTLSTIGYGRMTPIGFAANLVVTFEALVGFGFFAVVTGLVFSKFSRPTARVMFSRIAVIGPYEGVPHLMIRLANQRGNRIVDANVHVVLLRNEMSREGHDMRRFHDIVPHRSRVPILQLTWTLLHKIDEKSPLFGMDAEKLSASDAEIIISLTGLDETLSQTIHTRYSYVADEIICNAAYADIISRDEKGHTVIDYRQFHEVKPLAHSV